MVELKGLAKEIFLNKYAHPGELDWNDCAKRVAKHVSQAEDGTQIEWEKKFFEVISKQDFMPGGRILWGAGRPGQSMLNCYSLEPLDSVESLADFLHDVYKISTSGGGIGTNYSNIRVRSDSIQNLKFSAPGVISEMKKINSIAEEVKGGKNRRAALIGILNCDHPDVLDVIHAKIECGKLSNYNLSIAITNEFIKAIEKDKEWNFTFNNKKYYVYELTRIDPSGGKEKIRLTALDDEDAVGRAYGGHKKTFEDNFENPVKIIYKARDLWYTIIDNARKCGDPGLFLIDNANIYSPLSYCIKMNQTNPCGEIPLENAGNCCLGSINLSNMYDEKKNDVNWRKLAFTARIAVRFLDNIISVNNFPLPMTKEVANRTRRIGVGCLGYAHLLAKLGLKYNSNETIEFSERLFATLRNEIYMASIEIAKEKGAFPLFDVDQYLKTEFIKTLPQRIRRLIKRHGVRNGSLITQAPTGTISLVAQTSSSIEPLFSPVFERSYRDPQDPKVWKTVLVIDPLFKQMYLEGKNIDHIVGAHDISVEDHLNTQSAIQAFVDNSISKTINCPENIKTEELSNIILEFISSSIIKGLTIYRQNSRGIEPLKPVKIKSKKHLDELIKRAEEQAMSLDCPNGKCNL